MIFKNKKAEFGLKMFIFFFALTIISGIFFFLSVNMHYLLYDYGITPLIDVANNTALGISETAKDAITGASSSYLTQTTYMDYFFGVMLLSMFISGIISSIESRKYGLFSFFGMLTLGNMFLILLISFAVQVRGWFLNNIAYAILNENISMPIMEFFFNYTYQIVIIMFLIYLIINQLDLELIKEKAPAFFGKDKQSSESSEFSLNGGKFEE